jgi:DNA-binding transcriptional MerR regulator
MTGKFLRTSDLARSVGIHPNTVRLYVDWGLIPPVDRSPSGYRRFTQRHLDCLRLARMIYAADYPGRVLRGSGNKIIQSAVAGDWVAALEQAHRHLTQVKAELVHAEAAVTLLEQWAQGIETGTSESLLSIGETSKLLGVSLDVIRNWERNGLIMVPRNPDNGYRLFGVKEIGRLRVIRMLSYAGYSHMAILRMFIELDGGVTGNLHQVLDTPHPDEDIYLAADHWLSTLQDQKILAHNIIRMVSGQISTDVVKHFPR